MPKRPPAIPVAVRDGLRILGWRRRSRSRQETELVRRRGGKTVRIWVHDAQLFLIAPEPFPDFPNPIYLAVASVYAPTRARDMPAALAALDRAHQRFSLAKSLHQPCATAHAEVQRLKRLQTEPEGLPTSILAQDPIDRLDFPSLLPKVYHHDLLGVQALADQYGPNGVDLYRLDPDTHLHALAWTLAYGNTQMAMLLLDLFPWDLERKELWPRRRRFTISSLLFSVLASDPPQAFLNSVQNPLTQAVLGMARNPTGRIDLIKHLLTKIPKNTRWTDLWSPYAYAILLGYTDVAVLFEQFGYDSRDLVPHFSPLQTWLGVNIGLSYDRIQEKNTVIVCRALLRMKAPSACFERFMQAGYPALKDIVRNSIPGLSLLDQPYVDLLAEWARS